MGNYFAKPTEEIQPVEEVSSNDDNKTHEPVPVEIGISVYDQDFGLSFLREVSSDDFRDEIEKYWLNTIGHSIEDARKAGIEFIQQKCQTLGFKPQTAYLASIYLTRFLSVTRGIQVDENDYAWFTKVLTSVGCLSLSAKMGEIFVPPLLSFSMNQCIFDDEMIIKMELTLLRMLRWEMGLITPFAFTNLFAGKLTEIFSVPVVSSRVEYAIMSSMKDVKTMCYRPSVVALTATLIAVDDYTLMSMYDMRPRIVPLVTELAMSIDEVIICYIRIRGMFEPLRTGHLGRRRVSLSTVARGKGKTHVHKYTKML